MKSMICRTLAAAWVAGLAATTALAGLEVLPVNVADSAPVIDGKADDAVWKDAPKITDVKNFRGDIVMTLQAFYDRTRFYFLLDIRRPDPQLGAPEMEFYIRPVIRGHRPMDLVRKSKLYFSIRFDENGMVSDDYDGTVVLKTASNGTAGCTLEMALDLPQTMEWLPQVPQPGDYYDVAVRFKYPTAQRYTMYFFTNHRNELGPEMAKAILAGREKVTRPLLYFDYEVTCYEQLRQIDADLAELAKFDAPARAAAETGGKQLAAWYKLNESLSEVDYQSRRYFQFKALNRLAEDLRNARAAALTRLPQFGKNHALVFAVPCWNDKEMVNNFTLPEISLANARSVALRVAPGEIDSFSAGLWAMRELANVTFDVEPFRNAAGKTVDAAIEKFHVKCWYQGMGYTELTQSRIGLVPELLVKNSDLVESDHVLRNNLPQIYHNGRVARLYPDDSAELRPIRYGPAEFLRQFWVRFRFPEDTPAGNYTTELTVRAGNEVLGTLPVAVEVLPFQLGKSPIRSQIYTLSHWGEAGDELALAEIRNLVRHGVDTVGLHEKSATLPHVVELMKTGGLSVERIYLQGDGDFYIWPDIDQERLGQIVKAGLEAKKVPGVKDVYFYLPDEAMGEKLKKSIPIADEIHRLGGKTWGAASRGWINVPGADKIFNHMNQSGPPPIPKDLTTRIHRDGNEIFCYNFPQGGLEAPQRYRRHFGILMYGSDYDGTMTWCWYWPYEGAEYDCWNEFNEHFWKQHCMVYPTRNGVIDTLQYEGWARGINDLRYLGKLLELREKLLPEAKLGREIDDFIGAIKKDPYAATEDQEAVRDRMIDLILRTRKMVEKR